MILSFSSVRIHVVNLRRGAMKPSRTVRMPELCSDKAIMCTIRLTRVRLAPANRATPTPTEFVDAGVTELTVLHRIPQLIRTLSVQPSVVINLCDFFCRPSTIRDASVTNLLRVFSYLRLRTWHQYTA